MKTNLTLKGFKEYCGETLGALVVPVKHQLGEDLNGFWYQLKNVSDSYCGAAAGFCGFIYYRETVAFWRANRPKIMALINQYADDFGQNALEVVANFNGFKGIYTDDEIGRALYGNYNEELTGIYNGLAWFALEEVAHRYADYEYENR